MVINFCLQIFQNNDNFYNFFNSLRDYVVFYLYQQMNIGVVSHKVFCDYKHEFLISFVHTYRINSYVVYQWDFRNS